jgi:eukaryotic-like serine/threonine-protein kinase
MPLPANSRLGPYEIKSTLGVGGMGEVYRARDSRLNRDVAIKVLRQDSTNGVSTDLRSRFEREARAVAALNHPNIIAVYDFGIEASQQYIVSELLEGESLRSLLHGKPLPVRKLIDIAAQVADGLAAAHAAGIVHRDLKPENIMLTKDGRVKILDFGLARQSRTTGSPRRITGQEETVAPAVDETNHLTSEGAVMGTASYMSPEQALGKEVDYRSDQFSFGLILHEMASGKQAFARNSTVETMAAIVRDEPSAIEEKIPAPLKWIIDRCLHKEPEQRYESTRDLFHELKDLREHLSEAYTSAAMSPVALVQVNQRDWKLPTIIGACMVLAALLGYLLKPAGQNIGNYLYTPFASEATQPIWSPDGKAVAYSGSANGISQVFLRYLNSPVPVQLTHGKHSTQPLGWSSDKTHLIISENTDNPDSPVYKLYSIATVGGDPEFIMDFQCYACDLSRDGNVLATLRKGPEGEYEVAISDPLGSTLRAYTPAPFASKDVSSGPQLGFSPDGKTLLFFRQGDDEKDEAWLLPYPASIVPPKQILNKLPTLQGTPNFSWLPDNEHLVVSLAADQNSPAHLWMANIQSNDLTPLTTGDASEWSPVVSPDGKSILYSKDLDRRDVASVSLSDGSAKTMITSGRQESMAAWSANQAKLAWVTNRSGPFEIWLLMPDGSERPAVTAAEFPDGRNKWFMNPSLSPDGGRLAYVRIDHAGSIRLWLSSLSGGAPVRLTNDELSMEYGGSWSPDGSRFVYLQAKAGKAFLMMVKTNGGATPFILKEIGPVVHWGMGLPDWSLTGEWITYRDDRGWNLISPDGKTAKFLGKIETDYLAFSRDGKLLYGIQTGETEAGQDRATLFSLDSVTLRRKDIKELGKDFRPVSNFDPGIRFSLSLDGKSFVYTTMQYRNDLWMLQGYRQPGLWNQVKDAFHFGPTK